MKKVFLVDTENVNFKALDNANVLDKNDTIILFVTDRTGKSQFSDKKIQALKTKANIMKINVVTGTKNSLDFQLVSYLGLLIGLQISQKNNYYIVSKDKGFKSSVNLLYNCTNHKVHLIDEIKKESNNQNSKKVIKIAQKTPPEDLVLKLKEAGYKRVTAFKFAEIIVNENDYKSVLKEFSAQFTNSKDILNKCKHIINEYFSEKQVA